MPIPLQIPFTIFTDDGPMDGVSVTVYGNFNPSTVLGVGDTFVVTSIQGRDHTFYAERDVLDDGERRELLDIAQLDYLEDGGVLLMDYDGTEERGDAEADFYRDSEEGSSNA